MIDIKFRAWDGEKIYPSDYEIIKDICFSQDGVPNGIIIAKFRPDGDWEFQQMDAKLMQYTGLKDRNGKDIYEGDIVKCGDEVYRVEFKVKSWSSLFVLQHATKSWTYGGNGKCLEVIGNIYKNSELLDPQ